jgi:hypothetical protein
MASISLSCLSQLRSRQPRQVTGGGKQQKQQKDAVISKERRRPCYKCRVCCRPSSTSCGSMCSACKLARSCFECNGLNCAFFRPRHPSFLKTMLPPDRQLCWSCLAGRCLYCRSSQADIQCATWRHDQFAWAPLSAKEAYRNEVEHFKGGGSSSCRDRREGEHIVQKRAPLRSCLPCASNYMFRRRCGEGQVWQCMTCATANPRQQQHKFWKHFCVWWCDATGLPDEVLFIVFAYANVQPAQALVVEQEYRIDND